MSTARIIAALAIAFGIGFGCRRFDIPLPAPVTLLGATLVVTLTIGYLLGSK